MDQMSQKAYDFIIQYKKDHDGNSPDHDEIARAIGLRSKSGVNEYLDRLEALGKIRRVKGRSRMIFVVGGQWFSPDEVEMLKEEP